MKLPPTRNLVTRLTIRGFTLVELLVVIAVIVLLIAILLPVLKNARATADSMQCLSGTRQNSTAVTMYVQDHDDRFPGFKTRLNQWNQPYYKDSSVDYDQSALVSLELTRKEVLGSYLSLSRYTSGINYTLGITACPTNDVIYYYNEHLLGSDGHGSPNRWGPSTPGSAIRMASVLKPSQVFWGGDYLLNQNFYYGHLDGRNVSFVDTHAEMIRDQDIQDELWGDNYYVGVKPLTWPY